MGSSVVYAVKIALVVSATLALVVALNALIIGVTTFATNTALGEIIALISIYLPFSGGIFFGVISTALTAILAFLVAKKIYELLVNAQASA